jgi:hypothetical protein
MAPVAQRPTAPAFRRGTGLLLAWTATSGGSPLDRHGSIRPKRRYSAPPARSRRVGAEAGQGRPRSGNWARASSHACSFAGGGGQSQRNSAVRRPRSRCVVYPSCVHRSATGTTVQGQCQMTLVASGRHEWLARAAAGGRRHQTDGAHGPTAPSTPRWPCCSRASMAASEDWARTHAGRLLAGADSSLGSHSRRRHTGG